MHRKSIWTEVPLIETFKMATVEGDCLLKISNSDGLTKFLHDCVDELIGRKHINFDNYSSDIECTKPENKKARILIQNIFKQSVIDNEFTAKFKDLSIKDEEEIKECYEIRKTEILQAVLKEKLLKGGHTLVENLDWKLKWVIGSSNLASLSEALVQLDLHCFNNDCKSGRSTVNFEMNLEQVDNFISELQNIKNNLDK